MPNCKIIILAPSSLLHFISVLIYLFYIELLRASLDNLSLTRGLRGLVWLLYICRICRDCKVSSGNIGKSKG